MPENLAQWLWFAFYTLGSIGGLGFIALVVPILVDESVRLIRQRRAK